jgi:hypothetical protein
MWYRSGVSELCLNPKGFKKASTDVLNSFLSDHRDLFYY